MKKTQELLRDAFSSIPNSFAYREVRFYVYNAMQKLESIGKKEASRQKSKKEQEVREDFAKNEARKRNIPAYQSPFLLKQAIDIIDGMIALEQKKIGDLNKAEDLNKKADY